MKNVLAGVASLVVLAILVAGVGLAATPWLRRVQSVGIQDGRLVIETSPSGRLADPYTYEWYHSEWYISLSAVAIGITVVLVVCAALFIALYLGLTQAARRR